MQFCRTCFLIVRACPGRGVARKGHSAQYGWDFRGRVSNPCPGDPFRDHFSLLEKLLVICCFCLFISFLCLETPRVAIAGVARVAIAGRASSRITMFAPLLFFSPAPGLAKAAPELLSGPPNNSGALGPSPAQGTARAAPELFSSPQNNSGARGPSPPKASPRPAWNYFRAHKNNSGALGSSPAQGPARAAPELFSATKNNSGGPGAIPRPRPPHNYFRAPKIILGPWGPLLPKAPPGPHQIYFRAPEIIPGPWAPSPPRAAQGLAKATPELFSSPQINSGDLPPSPAQGPARAAPELLSSPQNNSGAPPEPPASAFGDSSGGALGGQGTPKERIIFRHRK